LLKPKIRARMKREMSEEKPTIWIGRNGVTDQLLREVSNQLDRHGIVKMRIQRSALRSEDAMSLIQKIVQGTGSMLIDQRGHAFALHRSRKGKKPL